MGLTSPSEISLEQQTEFPNIEITCDIPTSTSDSHNIHRDQGGKGTDSVRGVCPLSSRRNQLVAWKNRDRLRPRTLSQFFHARLSDFTNKRPGRETKHPNVWKELSNLSVPEPAEVEERGLAPSAVSVPVLPHKGFRNRCRRSTEKVTRRQQILNFLIYWTSPLLSYQRQPPTETQRGAWR
jgi:hypothetical protein